MKDLIEKILAYIPVYLMTLGSLLSGPKKYLVTTNPDTDEGFQNSLRFFAVTTVVVVIAQFPLLPKGADVWAVAATRCILGLVVITGTACNLCLAWRIVGGRFRIRYFFTIYAYMASVVLLGCCLFDLLARGTFKTFAPALYDATVHAMVVHQAIPSDVAQSKALLAALVVSFCGFIANSIWGFIAWGAFTQLTSTTRVRSFVASCLTALLSWPLLLVVALLHQAMAS